MLWRDGLAIVLKILLNSNTSFNSFTIHQNLGQRVALKLHFLNATCLQMSFRQSIELSVNLHIIISSRISNTKTNPRELDIWVSLKTQTVLYEVQRKCIENIIFIKYVLLSLAKNISFGFCLFLFQDGQQARFDFEGNLISRSTDIPTHLGLHHHSSEPGAAGYSLEELFLLARSKFLQQRMFALQVLTRIIQRVCASLMFSFVYRGIFSQFSFSSSSICLSVCL